MNSFFSKLNLKKNNKGQGTLEYILILSVSIIISLILIRGLTESVDGAILRFGGNLEKSLKSGRAPLHVYLN